ncbi:MAG: hypothetical protein ACRCX2_20505 [Paraclostridium sp.]
MCNIITTEEWDVIIATMLQSLIDNDDEWDYSGGIEKALQEIRDGDWNSYCPHLNRQTREMLPKELFEECKTDALWRGRCEDIDERDMAYIRDAIDSSNLPKLVFDGTDINDQGCCGCWSFNYYYVLAWLTNNQYFWRLED